MNQQINKMNGQCDDWKPNWYTIIIKTRLRNKLCSLQKTETLKTRTGPRNLSWIISWASTFLLIWRNNFLLRRNSQQYLSAPTTSWSSSTDWTVLESQSSSNSLLGSPRANLFSISFGVAVLKPFIDLALMVVSDPIFHLLSRSWWDWVSYTETEPRLEGPLSDILSSCHHLIIIH